MNNFDSVTAYFSYPEFVAMTETLLSEGKTTGNDQSAAMIEYTKLNLHRMIRWGKTWEVPEDIKSLMQRTKPQIWWVITEAWCGDSAQTLPMIYKTAAVAHGTIDLRIILRDEHPELMAKYLTNGSRSIPKLVAIDKTGKELFNWGPRPEPVQKIVMNWKTDHANRTYEDIKTEIHYWYSKDKGNTLTGELKQLLEKL